MLDGAGPVERLPNVVELAASLLFPRHAASTSVASNTCLHGRRCAATRHSARTGVAKCQHNEMMGPCRRSQLLAANVEKISILPSFGVLLCLVPLGSGRTAFASAVGSLPESAIPIADSNTMDRLSRSSSFHFRDGLSNCFVAHHLSSGTTLRNAESALLSCCGRSTELKWQVRLRGLLRSHKTTLKII